MNSESNSKRTYKITLICQSPLQLTWGSGGPNRIMRGRLRSLLRSLLAMPLDSEDSPAIRMEVEEVNPSQKLTTMKPSSTKTSSTKKLTSASSQEKEVAVASNLTDNRRESNWGSDWVDDGV